ncbi:MAG: type II toxin-antitoxin system RelE/ParE family toxin [Clostridia bacterium]|nr:type II toxin-antitoxin system RelE/ParE family toxin [Clostridia bacterium]
MRGTGGVRKMRFAFEQRGKRGSVRVIYVDFEVYQKIFLITAYPKNEKDNLTESERSEIKQMIRTLEEQLQENTK